MNIFATSGSPSASAVALCNVRVIKMAVESAQMLSTALSHFGIKSPYKPTHRNHPCGVWTRFSRENYGWLLEHFDHLCGEYTFRFGKEHKSHQHAYFFTLCQHHMPSRGFTTWPNCTEFKSITCVHTAYRMQLARKWQRSKKMPDWGARGHPDWWPYAQEQLRLYEDEGHAGS